MKRMEMKDRMAVKAIDFVLNGLKEKGIYVEKFERIGEPYMLNPCGTLMVEFQDFEMVWYE